jgi:nucleoid-associated protein YgaU
MPPQTMAIWAGAAGAVIVAGGAAAFYLAQPSFLWPPSLAPPAVSDRAAAPTLDPAKAPAVASASLPTAPASPIAPTAVKPTFDVVNVEPTGEAVVAGRAAPNAKIELRDAGRTVAEATTDNSGQFVIIPPTLTPGAHSLTLTTGSQPSAAETSNAVPVSVPEPPPKAVATATPSKPDATSPSPGAKASSAAALPIRIAVRSVEASAGGRLVARGVAEPNTTVRLYLSGAFVGDAKTKADGRWSLTIQHGMKPGAYEVRADQINPGDAAVVARAAAPFDYPAAPASAPVSVVASADAGPAGSADAPSDADVVVASVQAHHVERGQTLWGISQKYYGDGSRYQLIFAANVNQIQNPNVIYPGQTFVVPKPEPKP